MNTESLFFLDFHRHFFHNILEEVFLMVGSSIVIDAFSFEVTKTRDLTGVALDSSLKTATKCFSLSYYTFNDSTNVFTVRIWSCIISIVRDLFFFNKEGKITDVNVKEEDL